jgi:hypothetical protein
LHELKLDQVIASFRKVAPLGGKLENTNGPVEAIAANNVVDGLELQRKWVSVKDNPDASADFLSALNPPPATGERTTLRNELNATGVAFQFNPPDSFAPQSILLAVPAVPDKAWTVGDLQRVLLETLELARLRAVDAEALDQTGHYLPALYLAFNPNNDTISTDSARLAGVE